MVYVEGSYTVLKNADSLCRNGTFYEPWTWTMNYNHEPPSQRKLLMFIDPSCFFLLLDLRKPCEILLLFWMGQKHKTGTVPGCRSVITEIFVQIEPVTMWIWHWSSLPSWYYLFESRIGDWQNNHAGCVALCNISFLIHVFNCNRWSLRRH